jgi:hypothetical protein
LGFQGTSEWSRLAELVGALAAFHQEGCDRGRITCENLRPLPGVGWGAGVGQPALDALARHLQDFWLVKKTLRDHTVIRNASFFRETV